MRVQLLHMIQKFIHGIENSGLELSEKNYREEVKLLREWVG